MRRLPLLTPAQRQLVLTLATAMFGFAIAVSLYPLWLRPARPGQLPGYLAQSNIGERAPLSFFFSMIVLTIGAAIAFRPAVRRLTEPAARAWARNAAIAACTVALWHSIVNRFVLWTTIPALLVIIAAVLLRRVDARFSRADVILIPTAAAVFLALTDKTPLAVERAAIVSAAAVFAVRLAIVFIRPATALAAPLCFGAAPLALLLESHFVGRGMRYDAWPAIAIALLTPFILRSSLRDTPVAQRRLRWAIAFVVYPLAVYAYTSATSLAATEGKPRSDFFEEAQHLTPASEILKGEKPYRDIIPPHGLIQDGLLDVAILGKGPVTIGKVLRTRGTIVAGASIAIYALAAAVTGSAHVGIVAFSVATLMAYPVGSVRFMPWMAAVALLAAAARTRNRRLLAAGAAVTVLAGLTSIEFGVYSLLAVGVAVIRFGPERSTRLAALRAASIGAAIVAVPAILAMLAAGFFVDFLRVTLFEIATLGPVYALPPFTSPPSLVRQFPEVLTALFDRVATMYVLWFFVLVGTAVALARSRVPAGRRRARYEGLLIVAVSIVLASISYAERHHLYFSVLMPSFLTAIAWFLFRGRSSTSRLAGWALAIVLAILSGFTSHIAITGWLRRLPPGPVDPGWVAVGLPRAQGAWFREADVAILDSVKRYAEQKLAPDDTFFDFTNRPMLFFLLDRNVPVRQLEPAFYEREERQREVIAYLALNPHVRAAVVPLANGDDTGIDEVSNRDRAPIVWKYLQENFEPDFEEGPIVIWKRRSAPMVSAAPQPRADLLRSMR